MGQGISTTYGKVEVTNFLKERFSLGDNILDVGAGSGTWRWYLGSGYNIEAIEIWPESVEAIKNYYNIVYQIDVREFKYPHDYDLIIFGDIIEHLTVEDAQAVLAEAEKHAKHILIGVPYLNPQDNIYGNEAERHLQPDLTHKIFKERYPGYKLLLGRFDYYGYYYK